MNGFKNEISIELIYKKIDGVLNKQEEELFRNWMESSHEHKEYFERLRYFYDVEGDQGVSPKELEDGWKDFVKRADLYKRADRRKVVSRLVAVAASVVVLVVVGWIFGTKQNSTSGSVHPKEYTGIVPGHQTAILELADGKTYELGSVLEQRENIIGENIIVDSCLLSYVKADSPSAIVPAYNKLTVPRGGEYQLKLEDGTKIWLNSDTRLKYPAAFAGKIREVFLEGEAYFEVAKDSSRPFVVHAGIQRVTVLGTSFGMSCYSDDNMQSTTLVQGKVEVQFPGYATGTFLLEDGKQVLYDKLNRKVSQQQVNVREFVSWKEGKYVFTRKRLEDMLNTLSRWYDCQVFYQNSSCKEILFSGEIERFENFRVILKLIEKTSDVKFTVNNNIVIVAGSN